MRGCDMAKKPKVFIPKEGCTESSGACFTAGACLSDCQRIRQPEHIASAKCWCNPTKDYTDPETGRTVWLHRMVH